MAPDTIAIKRYVAGPKDKYGNVTMTWQTVATIKGHVQPQTSSEFQNTQTVTRYLVLVPLGTEIKAKDRIDWQGLTLEIDGVPAIYSNLPGMPGHVELIALIVSGGT